MSEKIDELIKEIAIKHGIVVGKDDPVLILHTINDKLIGENKQAHQEILAQFRQEMESISLAWKNDAKEKAEKVLNAALNSSKELMSKMMHDGFKEALDVVQADLNRSISAVHASEKRSRKYTNISLLASGLMFIAISIMLILKLI